MKIYEIGTGYTPIPAQMGAATEIVVEELTKSFLKQGRDVEIIDISASERPVHQLPIREVKVPSVFTRSDVSLGIMHKLKRVAYSVALAGELRKILKSGKEKVVLHFHNQYNLFFFLKLAPRKIRERALIAYTNHSGIWNQPWNDIKDTIRKRYFQEAECMKKADIVFVLNQKTIDNAVEHLEIPSERFVIVGNGVNIDMYRPLYEEAKRNAKKKYGLDGKKVILHVGSVNENKGQARVVEMLIPHMKSNKDLVYAYAGGIVSEEYHDKLKMFAEQHGLQQQVIYLGMLSPGHELNDVYNSAEATILASQFEAFGMVIIESLAAGVPVMVNRDTYFAGQGGCIPIDKDNVGQIVRQIFEDKDYMERARTEARKNAEENYSWYKIACDYAEAMGIR